MVNNVTTRSPEYSDMASKGRNGDTEVAHVTVDEVVVPHSVLATPEGQNLKNGFARVGLPIEQYTVEDTQSSKNPTTGKQEYANTYVTRGYKEALGRSMGLPWDHPKVANEAQRRENATFNQYDSRTPEQAQSYGDEISALQQKAGVGQGSGAAILNSFNRNPTNNARISGGMTREQMEDEHAARNPNPLVGNLSDEEVMRSTELLQLLEGRPKETFMDKYGAKLALAAPFAVAAAPMIAGAGATSSAGGGTALTAAEEAAAISSGWGTAPAAGSVGSATIPGIVDVTGMSGVGKAAVSTGLKAGISPSTISSIASAAPYISKAKSALDIVGKVAGGAQGSPAGKLQTSQQPNQPQYGGNTMQPAPVITHGLNSVKIRNPRDTQRVNPDTGHQEYYDAGMYRSGRNPQTGKQEYADKKFAGIDQSANQAAKISAGFSEDVLKSGAAFQEAARANPDAYLKYLSAAGKNEGFINPVDLDPITPGQQTSSAAVNKAMGKNIGYLGDVGRGQLGGGGTGVDYLSLNPDKISDYTAQKRLVNPKYTYTPKDVLPDDFDAQQYITNNPNVSAQITAGDFTSPGGHYYGTGKDQGYSYEAPAAPEFNAPDPTPTAVDPAPAAPANARVSDVSGLSPNRTPRFRSRRSIGTPARNF